MNILKLNARLFLSTLLLVGVLYFLFPEAQAGGIPYPVPGGVPGSSLSSGGTPQGAVEGFAVLIQRIADGAAALAASVAILFVVINGARLTFSFGNTEAMGKAKKGLIWAAAGLVVIIFAYIITKTVVALVYSGSDGSAVIGTGNLAPTTTTPGNITPVNEGEVGADGIVYLLAGQRSITFYQQGAERTFSIYVPTRLDVTKAHPAVLVLHDEFSDGSGAQSISEMNTKANEERFIAVYPEAGNRYWNDGRATTVSSIDDVAYVNTMLNKLADEWQVDRSKVFVAGISDGGMMTQRLACELTSSFAGFAVVAANMPVDLSGGCHPGGRAPMLFFNGTEDPLMPYDGGDISSIPALGIGAGGTVLSYPDTVDFWANKDQCATSIVTAIPDTTPDNTTVEKLTYDTCNQGDLEAFKINGGGHNWPGSVGASSLTGNTSRDISATDEMITFFQANGLTPAP